jgi:hypothetical protein
LHLQMQSPQNQPDFLSFLLSITTKQDNNICKPTLIFFLLTTDGQISHPVFYRLQPLTANLNPTYLLLLLSTFTNELQTK